MTAWGGFCALVGSRKANWSCLRGQTRNDLDDPYERKIKGTIYPAQDRATTPEPPSGGEMCVPQPRMDGWTEALSDSHQKSYDIKVTEKLCGASKYLSVGLSLSATSVPQKLIRSTFPFRVNPLSLISTAVNLFQVINRLNWIICAACLVHVEQAFT